MKKFILKHLLKNGRGTGKLLLTPEVLLYLLLMNYIPGMNYNSNISVQQANNLPRLKVKVSKDNPKTRAEGSYRNIERRRLTGKTKDQEDTEKDIKFATLPTVLSLLADASHTVGLGAMMTALGSGLATAPLATLGAVVGGSFGANALDKVSRRFTGKTWAENIKNKLGLLTTTLPEVFNPGMLIGGVAGAGLTGLAKNGVSTLIRMDMPRYGYTPTTKYYFDPTTIGINNLRAIARSQIMDRSLMELPPPPAEIVLNDPTLSQPRFREENIVNQNNIQNIARDLRSRIDFSNLTTPVDRSSTTSYPGMEVPLRRIREVATARRVPLDRTRQALLKVDSNPVKPSVDIVTTPQGNRVSILRGSNQSMTLLLNETNAMLRLEGVPEISLAEIGNDYNARVAANRSVALQVRRNANNETILLLWSEIPAYSPAPPLPKLTTRSGDELSTLGPYKVEDFFNPDMTPKLDANNVPLYTSLSRVRSGAHNLGGWPDTNTASGVFEYLFRLGNNKDRLIFEMNRILRDNDLMDYKGNRLKVSGKIAYTHEGDTSIDSTVTGTRMLTRLGPKGVAVKLPYSIDIDGKPIKFVELNNLGIKNKYKNIEYLDKDFENYARNNKRTIDDSLKKYRDDVPDLYGLPENIWESYEARFEGPNKDIIIFDKNNPERVVAKVLGNSPEETINILKNANKNLNDHFKFVGDQRYPDPYYVTNRYGHTTYYSPDYHMVILEKNGGYLNKLLKYKLKQKSI